VKARKRLARVLKALGFTEEDLERLANDPERLLIIKEAARNNLGLQFRSQKESRYYPME
jgi:hypothetical protein